MEKNHIEPVTILMVGIGGYGYYYLKALFDEFPADTIQISGVVDPYPQLSDHLPEIENRGIPVFSSIDDFYNAGYTADLAIICSPIHFHVPQSLTALANDSNVLCEKPVAATIQEVDDLIKARNAAGKWVMVGYQWSYSDAIQSLKADIQEGIFGRPIRLKTLRLWHRNDEYYMRNSWAGKKKDSERRWILDSPANNALAHELHNLFYLLGKELHTSAGLAEITAETYRVNPIENFDTVACRIFTDEETEILFYGSHATDIDIGPLFQFEFENAVVVFGDSIDTIIATDRNNKNKQYGSPDNSHQFLKLFKAVESVGDLKPIMCGLEAARSQVLCINGIQESVAETRKFPESITVRDDIKRGWSVKGLASALYNCYLDNILPHEAKLSWAIKGRTIDLNRYRFFPGGIRFE